MSDVPPHPTNTQANIPRQEPFLTDAGYLMQRNEQVYYTCYAPPKESHGSILLAGPFAFERGATYTHWHKWALFLAAGGFRVMRFDYRGHAESTGRFDEFGPRDWSEDVRLCATWLREQDPDGPLLLHGLRIGSLLAHDAFRDGIGDGLLMWSPPSSARDMLYALLRLRLAADFSLPSEQRRSRDDYVKDLEAGKVVEVDCFPWSRKLWEDAAAFTRPEDETGGLPGSNGCVRQWKTVHMHTLPSNPGLAFDPMTWSRVRFRNPDFTDLFERSRDWLLSAAKDIRCARSSDTN